MVVEFNDLKPAIREFPAGECEETERLPSVSRLWTTSLHEVAAALHQVEGAIFEVDNTAFQLVRHRDSHRDRFGTPA